MGKKRKAEGHEFYKGAGLEKQILVHVSRNVHAKLMRSAKRAEESLQVTVRKILEKHVSR